VLVHDRAVALLAEGVPLGSLDFDAARRALFALRDGAAEELAVRVAPVEAAIGALGRGARDS